MLNESFILSRIEPYLNSKREISESEFSEIFSMFSTRDKYEIINIMIKNDIEYVDKKEIEVRDNTIKNNQNITVTEKIAGKDYKKMLQINNEQLCILYQKGDIDALSALLEKNQKFIYQIAKQLWSKYNQNTLMIDDLVIEGNIGMIEAANKFDVNMDLKFLTYAWHWVRQKMSRAIIDTGYAIRIPVHMFEKIIKLSHYRKQNPLANKQELIKILEMDGVAILSDQIDELIIYSELYLNTTSMNTLVGENAETELIEFIPSEESVEDIVMEKFRNDELREVLALLSQKEKAVIEYRFGFIDGREQTLEEIGQRYGVTRERIRQIEAKALRKLKHPAKSKRLSVYMEE